MQNTTETLSEQAEVFYVADNCRNTQYVITRLLGWSNMFSHPGLVEEAAAVPGQMAAGKLKGFL